jgi:hypothetical protein
MLIMSLMLLGLNLVLTDNQVRAASCDQIRTACKDAGFVLGGGARNGLLLDCFNPIVAGTAQPKSASRPLPTISPQLVNACREGRTQPLQAPETGPPDPSCSMKGTTGFDCTGSPMGSCFINNWGSTEASPWSRLRSSRSAPSTIFSLIFTGRAKRKPYPLARPMGPPLGSSGIFPLETASTVRISWRTICT